MARRRGGRSSSNRSLRYTRAGRPGRVRRRRRGTPMRPPARRPRSESRCSGRSSRPARGSAPPGRRGRRRPAPRARLSARGAPVRRPLAGGRPWRLVFPGSPTTRVEPPGAASELARRSYNLWPGARRSGAGATNPARRRRPDGRREPDRLASAGRPSVGPAICRCAPRPRVHRPGARAGTRGPRSDRRAPLRPRPEGRPVHPRRMVWTDHRDLDRPRGSRSPVHELSKGRRVFASFLVKCVKLVNWSGGPGRRG